jgi:hypothetical protein
MLDTATSSFSNIVKHNLEQQEKLRLMTRLVKLMEDNYKTMEEIHCLHRLDPTRGRRNETDAKPSCPPSVVVVDDGAQKDN